MKNPIKALLLSAVSLLAIALVSYALPDTTVGTGVLMSVATFSPMMWNQGQNNMGGFKDYVIWYPLSILESCPQLPANPSTAEDEVTVTGKFVLKTGEQPVFIYATEGTVGFNAEAVGEIDGKSFQQNIEFLYPGSNKKLHSYAARFKNMPGIAVIVDENGLQQMVGSDEHPCYLSPAYEGGKERADRRGMTFTGVCASNYSALFLDEQLDINPLTGTVTYAETGSGSGAGQS